MLFLLLRLWGFPEVRIPERGILWKRKCVRLTVWVCLPLASTVAGGCKLATCQVFPSLPRRGRVKERQT